MMLHCLGYKGLWGQGAAAQQVQCLIEGLCFRDYTSCRPPVRSLKEAWRGWGERFAVPFKGLGQ